MSDADTRARGGRRGILWELLQWLGSVALMVILFVLLRIFVFGVYYVPTGSMTDTIQVGDQLIGEKISYRFASPKVGEIVTFDDPDGSGETLIKRIIATSGQTIDMHDGKLYIDGVEQEESYTKSRPTYALTEHAANLSGGIKYPYRVPEGCVWLMGDNRTNSLDSRYFGAVSTTRISSHALFIYLPFKDARTL